MCLPGLVVSDDDDSSDGSDGSGGSDDTSEGQRWRVGIQCAAEAPSLFILTVRCSPFVFEEREERMPLLLLSSFFLNNGVYIIIENRLLDSCKGQGVEGREE